MKTLKLSLKGLADRTWYVTDDDPETFRLFHTNTLPTPFTSHTPVGRVVRELERLNPGAKIIVE